MRWGADVHPEPGLSWPIKAAFRSYVLSLPDGAAEAAYGARATEEEFWFPPAEGSPLRVGERTVLVFDGEVRFGGHHGLLLVAVARPAVETGPDGVVEITIDYPWLAQEDMGRVAIARGVVADAAGAEQRIGEVRLTETGSDLFGGVYAEGDLLDDLRVLAYEVSPRRWQRHPEEKDLRTDRSPD